MSNPLINIMDHLEAAILGLEGIEKEQEAFDPHLVAARVDATKALDAIRGKLGLPMSHVQPPPPPPATDEVSDEPTDG